MIYRLSRTVALPIDIDTAWRFFSDPRNLPVITPPSLKFKLITENVPTMYAGQMLTYSVRPLFNIPLRWVSEITHVKAPYFFVDEQRYGPYRLWHHQHHFRETESGVEIEDIVDYILPFSFLGALAHRFVVANKLNEIFNYRTEVLKTRFSKSY